MLEILGNQTRDYPIKSYFCVSHRHDQYTADCPLQEVNSGHGKQVYMFFRSLRSEFPVNINGHIHFHVCFTLLHANIYLDVQQT